VTNLETGAVNQFVASTSQTLWHKTQVLCIGTWYIWNPNWM